MKVFAAITLLACVVVAASALKFPGFPKERVVNGVNAAEGQAPYIVSLSSTTLFYEHSCGGSIIDKEWILTAGHCLSRSGKVRRLLYAGITNKSNRTEGQKLYSDYAIIHPKFQGTGQVGPYDIALLHLEEPLVFNNLVKPIALPFRKEVVTGSGKLYGWGRTNSSLPASIPMQTVQTDILEYEECKEILGENSPLHPLNVCSSSHNQQISACSGDSGGPLVKEYPNGVTQQVGVTSWVYMPCGEQNAPSVYTKVSEFVDWIAESKADYYKYSKFCGL